MMLTPDKTVNVCHCEFHETQNCDLKVDAKITQFLLLGLLCQPSLLDVEWFLEL